MKDFWIKNKYTIISMLIYVVVTLLVGDLRSYRLPLFIISLMTIPLVYNMKIDSKSIGWAFLAGFIFGIYITPFEVSSMSISLYNRIAYFVMLISFNINFYLHRDSYLSRKHLQNLADERNNRLQEIFNPVKKRFFQ